MKKLFIPLVLLLAGCGANSPNATVTTHQPLQAIEMEQNTPIQPLETSTTTFENQQEFVDYMYERVRSLEDTLTLLNNNLTQIISYPEDNDSYQGIRESLLDQIRTEITNLNNLTPINDQVINLKTYVVQAYHYNLEDKVAQYEIAQSTTTDARQTLLTANQENEKLATHYLDLAWEELDRLSETTFSRK